MKHGSYRPTPLNPGLVRPGAHPKKKSNKLQHFEERYPDEKPRSSWSAYTGEDGRYLLHGTETWFYPDGRKEWEATYQDGNKIGSEMFWSPGGEKLWTWEHREDGTSLWTGWWPNGEKADGVDLA